MIRFVPRHDPRLITGLIGTAAALAVTLIAGAAIFAAMGFHPVNVLIQLFITPVSNLHGIADLLIKACPLIIIGLGLAFAFRANVWNIGAEGQYIIGALAAGILALSFPNTNSPLLLPAVMLVAITAGALWAAIAAALKLRFGANEILITLMLNYIAVYILDWFVRGPLRDPLSFGFPKTPLYPEAALIGKMPLPFIGQIGQLHTAVVLIFVLPLLGWWLLRHSLAGFQIRVLGYAPKAAGFAGFNQNHITMIVMLGSGGLAGLAGMIEVSANIERLQPHISFGYGFTAIIVAFLGRLHPIAVLLAGLVVALMELGGDTAQITLGVPKVVTGIFKGMLLFFLLAATTFQHYKPVIQYPAFRPAQTDNKP